jgi:hypothetical protein
LEQIHKFPVDDARKAALKATRGDDVENGYYEEVSDILNYTIAHAIVVPR